MRESFTEGRWGLLILVCMLKWINVFTDLLSCLVDAIRRNYGKIRTDISLSES